MAGLDDYRAYLDSIVAERGDYTLEDALSLENIDWCLKRLQKGDDWEVLRRRLGFGPTNRDVRWRRLRRELARGMEAKDEDSLIEHLAEGLESAYERERVEARLDKILDSGPQTKEDRINWPSYLKLRLEAIRDKVTAAKSLQDVRLEEKRVKNIDNKYGGAQITIINNIPRPDREVIEQSVDSIAIAVKSIPRPGDGEN